MFARKTCYFFVRPKKRFLEVCVFLGRTIKASQVRRVDRVSKSKLVHIIRITHRIRWRRRSRTGCRKRMRCPTCYRKRKPKAARAADNNQMAEKRTLRSKRSAAKRDDSTRLQRVRRICCSIPGIVEKISHGAPTFFTPKRVFAIFVNNHHDDGHVAVWVPAAPGVQAALIEEARDTYFRPPYVGVAGWVGLELSKVNDEQLGAVIREAFRLVTAKTSASDRSGRSQPARASKAPRRLPKV